jgi:hypothetical protein
MTAATPLLKESLFLKEDGGAAALMSYGTVQDDIWGGSYHYQLLAWPRNGVHDFVDPGLKGNAKEEVSREMKSPVYMCVSSGVPLMSLQIKLLSKLSGSL